MNFKQHPWALPALRGATIYAVAGGLWILLSDRVLEVLVPNHDTYAMLQTWKGWFYILITALLVYWLLAKSLRQSAKHQEAITESQLRLQRALDAVRDGVWDWDLTTNEVYFSPGYTAMLGYSDTSEFNTVHDWLAHMHPDDVEHALAVSNECIEGVIDHFAMEFRLRATDGSWVWILGRGQAVVRDENGRATRLIGTHTNITERKLAENELRTLQNSLDSIINSMPSVIAGLTREGTVTQWNPAAADITGIAADQAQGRPLREVGILPPDMVAEIETAVERGERLERPGLRLDGGRRIVDVLVCPLEGEGMQGAVLRVDDVTEQTRLRQLMIQSEKMLSVGGLAAGMAHELNNPLSGILQGVQNISRRTDSALPANRKAAEAVALDLAAMDAYFEARGIAKFLQGAKDSALRAADIISSMLAFSHENDTAVQRADVNELLDKAVELAASNYDPSKRMDFRKIVIEREYAPDLPPIAAAPTQIEQVFLNILKNAAQAMGGAGRTDAPPTITLRSSLAAQYARVQIEDNGPGFDENARKRLFEPFFTTKPPGEGTGLGLSVSYFIVTNNHNGQITAENVPGGGARFTLTLPLAD